MPGFWSFRCEASWICSVWTKLPREICWSWGPLCQRDPWKAQGCGMYGGPTWFFNIFFVLPLNLNTQSEWKLLFQTYIYLLHEHISNSQLQAETRIWKHLGQGHTGDMSIILYKLIRTRRINIIPTSKMNQNTITVEIFTNIYRSHPLFSEKLHLSPQNMSN